VLESEVLVLELVAVDRLATGAVVVGKVTTLEARMINETSSELCSSNAWRISATCSSTYLAHETGNDAVKGRSLKAESLLSGAVPWKMKQR